MSGIDPLSSSSQNIGPTPETSSSQPIVPLLSDDDVPQDSIGSFSSLSAPSTSVTTSVSHITLEEPSLLGFSKSISLALSRAKQTAFETEQQESLLYKDYRNNAIATFPDLLDSLNRIMDLPPKLRIFYAKEATTVGSLNAAITTYNQQVAASESPAGADAAQIQAMNNAISLYNLGLMSETQFNAVAANYNSYMDARNAQIAPYKAALQAAYDSYNQEMASYGPEIDSLNKTLTLARQPNLPIPPTLAVASESFFIQPLAPQTRPVAEVEDNTHETNAPQIANPPIPSLYVLMFEGTLPILLNFLASAVSLREKIDSNIDYQEFVKYYLNNKLPSLPKAYVNPLPESPQNNQGGVGLGGGPSLASAIIGLNAANVEKVFSQELFTQANQMFINTVLDQQQTAASDVTSQMQLLVLQQLMQSGLFAGNDALKTLAEKFTEVGNNPTAISAAIGLAFTDQILKLISTGELRQAVAAILKNSGLNNVNSKFEEAVDLYTALVNLNLIKVGISQLAQSLGLPNLPAQLLGNLDSPPPPPSPQATLSDVLSNPVTIAYLKAELAKNLVDADELSQDAVQELINDIINGISTKNIQTNLQLGDAILEALNKHQVSPGKVSDIFNAVSDFVKAEISSSYVLDTGIKQDSIERETLIATIIRETNIRSDIVRQSVNEAAVAKEYDSVRELRDSIVNSIDKALHGEQQQPVEIPDNVRVQDNVVVVEDQPDNYVPDNNQPTVDRRPTTAEEHHVDNSTELASQASQNTPSRGTILNAVTHAVTDQALASANVSLSTPVEIPPLPVLQTELQTTITSRLSPSLGVSQATDFANQVVTNLTGDQQVQGQLQNPLSFTRQIQDQIDTVKRYNSESLNQALQNTLAESQKTNVDLYSFNLKLMDPAYTLIHSMWTGIMYQGQGTLPTNFQHALQFTI